MVVLADRDLLRRCRRGLLLPWRAECVQPASIDVHLSDSVCLESADNPELITTQLEGPYAMQPQEFLLGCTAERVSIPLDCVGDFVLRSTVARMGLNHALSGLLDPGFEGQVTLELVNVRRFWPVTIQPGMRIGQIVLHRLSRRRPLRSYAQIGHYQGQRGATASNYNV